MTADGSGAALEVSDLVVQIQTSSGVIQPVNAVNFAVRPGETLCIVGESGCGKSTTALAVMRLLAEQAKITGGSVRLGGRELLTLNSREMEDVRGKEIGMIFQNPMSSLNPVLTIGDQIGEALSRHTGLRRQDVILRTLEVLSTVGLPMTRRRLGAYPHQLSGGMRQRVMIAMALSCNPSVLIADEPTTALDVTIQAQILELLREQAADRDMALVLVTHDLGVVAQIADRVAVMYSGRVVEEGPVDDLFARPAHPYTRGLLQCVPNVAGPTAEMLYAIPGEPPEMRAGAAGCPFEPRCSARIARCKTDDPALEVIDGARRSHRAACWSKQTTPLVAGRPADFTADGSGGKQL